MRPFSARVQTIILYSFSSSSAPLTRYFMLFFFNLWTSSNHNTFSLQLPSLWNVFFYILFKVLFSTSVPIVIIIHCRSPFTVLFTRYLMLFFFYLSRSVQTITILFFISFYPFQTFFLLFSTRVSTIIINCFSLSLVPFTRYLCIFFFVFLDQFKP